MQTELSMDLLIKRGFTDQKATRKINCVRMKTELLLLLTERVYLILYINVCGDCIYIFLFIYL